MKLNITDDVLDRLGFSAYWDENGSDGTRSLLFSNNVRFTITEQCQMDDGNEGFGSDPIYVSNHFAYKTLYLHDDCLKHKEIELYFLHDILNVIKRYYKECKIEFINICKKANMGAYI